MPVAARFTKAPGEVKDFDLDFSDEMAETADTASAFNPVETQIPAGITLTAAYWVPETNRIKVWFAGGASGQKYTCTAWLNTTGGRRLEFDFLVRVKD